MLCDVYVYVLLFEGKCKWSYGPSCPVDFPLNIFIHLYIACSVKPVYVLSLLSSYYFVSVEVLTVYWHT